MEAILFVGAVVLIVYVLSGLPDLWDEVTDGGFDPHPFAWGNQSKSATGSVLEAIYCGRCYKRYDHRIHHGQGVESYGRQTGTTEW